MKQLLILLFLFSLSSLLASDFGTIKGNVIDQNNGTPIVGANVIIVNTNLGTSTDAKGFYKIQNVPAGTFTLKASALGYKNKITAKIKVTKDNFTLVNFKLNSTKLEVEELIVLSDVENLSMSKSISPGLALRAGEYFFRHNTEEYSKIDESGFFNVIKKPLSTFAADIDGASYSNARRFLMRDQLPYKDVIRTEEFINYFSYDYRQPTGENPLSINLEYSQCPWNKENNLIHIGLQGKQFSFFT